MNSSERCQSRKFELIFYEKAMTYFFRCFATAGLSLFHYLFRVSRSARTSNATFSTKLLSMNSTDKNCNNKIQTSLYSKQIK